MSRGSFRSWGIFEEREVIGRPDYGGPLLTRWCLFRCPWFTVKVHQFHRSDPSCLHDHPWPFISLILRGGYYETVPAEVVKGARYACDPSTETVTLWHGPGSLLLRPAAWRHRVELRTVGYAEGSPRVVEPLTLVVTGPRVREWGFWTRAKGWIPWRGFGAAEDDC